MIEFLVGLIIGGVVGAVIATRIAQVEIARLNIRISELCRLLEAKAREVRGD